MGSPDVYDKAKYHFDTVAELGLSDEHAANHTVMFLRWLIEHGMMSDFFEQESQEPLRQFRAGQMSIHEIYEWWDGCLVNDMLSEEGNAFAMHYFDMDRGRYMDDYVATLQGTLPTEFHVEYSEHNYQKLCQVIDGRYAEWKDNPKADGEKPTKNWWWPF